MIPIGDEPNYHRVPWVNYALIAANVLVFVLFQGAGRGAAYEASIERHAFVPADPSLASSFTSMFLHGGWMHLFGNMLFLWVFGDNVEARLGHAAYLAAYLATGLAAGLLHGMQGPTSPVPSLGASGAISGVQGLYLVAFPRNRVRLLIIFFMIVRVVLVPALWIILFWFVVNDLVPTLSSHGNAGGIAHFAHLGGFAAGILLCFAVRPFLGPGPEAEGDGPTTRRRGRAPDGFPPGGPEDPWVARRGPATSRLPTDLAGGTGLGAEPEILGLWRAGRQDQAADALVRAASTGRRLSLPESDFLQLALHLERSGRFDGARVAFDAFLDAHPHGRGAPLAALGAGLILARHDHDGAAARPYLEEALSSPYAEEAVRRTAREELDRLGQA